MAEKKAVSKKEKLFDELLEMVKKMLRKDISFSDMALFIKKLEEKL